jgi:beta-lactamase class A
MQTLTKRVLTLAAPLTVSAGLLAGCSSTPSSTTNASTTASTTESSNASRSADPTASATATESSATDAAAFAKLETQFHAQFGLYAINTGTGQSVAYQADQRFAFCSTIKAFAASVLLQRDSDQQLSQVINYSKSDLVDYSPITSQHVATGMTLTSVLAAALEVSDNTALNLMLNQIGGPSALQAALRGLGDTTTNVDRAEPTVNSATPGDTRDTSTARALATDLRTFVLGNALSTSRRAQLVSWLKANTTGGPYIRAAVPSGWQVGDKTGNGDYGTRNDLAVLWPPTGAPIVIAVLSNRGDNPNAASDDALIADATKVALRSVG